MHSKQRNLPLEAINWTEKDVKITKISPNMGAVSKDTKLNVMLSRRFFFDVENLSSERYREITRLDVIKRKFIHKQQMKAEKTMPGLLPYVINRKFLLPKVFHIFRYIEPISNDMNSSTPSRHTKSRFEPFISSSFESFLSRSNTKFESTFHPKQQSTKMIKTRQFTPIKSPNPNQKSIERINGLAQSKNQRSKLTTPSHVRRNYYTEALNVQDIFGDIDDISNDDSLIPETPKIPADDKRFQQLIYLFSDVYECKRSNLHSLKSIVELNPSLQNEDKQSKTMNVPVSHLNALEHHQEILSDGLNNTTNMYSIDADTS